VPGGNPDARCGPLVAGAPVAVHSGIVDVPGVSPPLGRGAAGLGVEAVELVRIEIPLVTPFRTSFGSQSSRDVLLVRVVTPGAEGWGECVAMRDPLYSTEFVSSAELVMREHLLPRLLGTAPLAAEDVAAALAPIKGHRMAKAALELAWLDAQLREAGTPLARYLGATRDAVDCGVSVGIMEAIPALLDAVEVYLAQGYRRIKLKIEPGWDVEPVRAVRERFGAGLLLQVDANTAYTLADAQHLARLDEFDLLLIEQPLDEELVAANAELAKVVRTPICLDESIVSAQVAVEAIDMGACSIINIKAGRVGGYLEARRIHDLCAERGVPVWCGGMLETGIGRAANVALAALPNFTLPGDTSASDRYFREDITPPFVLEDGRLRVPTGPGLGVDVLPAVVDALAVSRETVRAGG
jgi:O-succinylbenzoate synthase